MNVIAIETHFFQFESDFVDTFRCIPMIVRYKLDTCGIKLKLPEWVKLSVDEKEQLAYLPCHTEAGVADYRKYLQDLVRQRTGHEASQLPPVDAAWDIISEVPDEIQQKALEWECAPLTLDQWLQINTLQRFALVKLSRSGHEGKNFPRALKEFGIS